MRKVKEVKEKVKEFQELEERLDLIINILETQSEYLKEFGYERDGESLEKLSHEIFNNTVLKISYKLKALKWVTNDMDWI